jgi:uncharacterized protein (TIGR02271 family)
MPKTVVGFFDNFRQAENAVEELNRSGFRREDLSIIANQEVRSSSRTQKGGGDDDGDAGTGAAVGATTGAVVGGAAGLIASLAGLSIPVVGPILAAGPIVAMLSGAGVGAVAGGLIGALVNLGVPEEEARVYEEGIKRGGTLVTLKTDDAKAQTAADIMNRHGAVDIKQRATQWRQGATAGSTTSRSTTMQGNQHTHQHTEQTNYQQKGKAGEEIRVPVVEEELRVGKREVETGGVRVEQKVTEKPVREQVELHEEKVNVQRRPTDRPATAADLRQPGEQSFEVRETREEAVVQKGARVVEEVVVSKEERDRTQTIQDTLRRKDVEVHQMGGHRGDSDYSIYENDFRTYHTKNFANSGSTYDQWSPAYRYGHSLASNERYRGKDWNAFESDARREWESKNPGTWDKMKDAVRYGWDRVRQGAHNMTH